MNSITETTLNNKTAWLSFIVNKYATIKNMKNSEAFSKIETTGALEYLDEFYDTEHLESPQWTVEHIDEYIDNHKVGK